MRNSTFGPSYLCILVLASLAFLKPIFPDDPAPAREPAPEAPKEKTEKAEGQAPAGGYLGVHLAPVPEALSAHLQLSSGAMIEGISPESPAEKAGFKRYDVITAIAGEAVDGPEAASRRIRSSRSGETVKIAVRRGTESLNLEAKLGARPEESSAVEKDGTNLSEPRPKLKLKAKAKAKVERGFLGVLAQDVPPDLAVHLGLEDGEGARVAEVVPDSAAAKAGIEAQDVITALDGQKVGGVPDFLERMRNRKAGEEMKLDLIHKGEKKSLQVVLGKRTMEQTLHLPGNPFPIEPGDPILRPRSSHKGRIILRDPDGSEHSIEIPEPFFKARESAEDILRDLEGRLKGFQDTQIPEIKESLRKSLRALENQLRDEETQLGDGLRRATRTEERVAIVRLKEGDLEITARDENGLRTLTVKKGDQVIKEGLQPQDIDTLPSEMRDAARKALENLPKADSRPEKGPGRKKVRILEEGEPTKQIKA